MMTHWFTADTGHWLHWRWEEVKLLWLEAQAKLSWQTMAFCVKQHKTQAVACLRCAWRGNLQNDSFWKHLVGIVQHKLLWNMLYTVFLTHNWTNKTNNWFMFMCVLYLPLVFWPTCVFIWHMVTFLLKHFKTCLCWRCCFDPYYTTHEDERQSPAKSRFHSSTESSYDSNYYYLIMHRCQCHFLVKKG